MQNNIEVATGVANLGNTCYMNAVLQALAHAPELCMAVECEPHSPKWVAKRKQSNENTNHNIKKEEEDGGHDSHADKSLSTHIAKENFCLLHELEQHLAKVHDGRAEAVTPADFVNGFIDHVAPCFKLGVQEDSHEFLRLLIDAMQKSAMTCRDDVSNNSKADGEVGNVRVKMENDYDNNQVAIKQEDGAEEMSNESTSSSKIVKEGDEYPFRLFSGKVESIVKCSNCGAASSTIDPIEDIGLEVTHGTRSSHASSSSYGRNGSTRSISPTPVSTPLSDVTSALEKFIRTEHLDSGYKCESCSTVGRATKQSKLAAIPPILTLHLKRFRYGNDKMPIMNGYAPTSSSRRRSSELSSLMGGSGMSGMMMGDIGTSGSAKIEGHVKFEQVFDIRPYLTEEKQKEVRSMLCRLFAVIVHTGKNSHSGHYICYVRNVAKNEWWKMDDARVTRVSREEVEAAEAYMLFYRVVDHPVSVDLKNKQKLHREQLAKELDEAKIKAENEENVVEMNVPDNSKVADGDNVNADSNKITKGLKRKRDDPEYRSGEDWARKMTSKPKSILQAIRIVQDYFSDRIQFKQEYFDCLKQEVEDGGRVGSGPSFGVSVAEDINDCEKVMGSFSNALWDVFLSILPEDKDELDDMLKTNGENAVDTKTTSEFNYYAPSRTDASPPNETSKYFLEQNDNLI